MSFHSSDDVAMMTPSSRPLGLRRSSSYGFGIGIGQPTPNSPSGFEADAFAPLCHGSQSQSADPWARMRETDSGDKEENKRNPWAAFGIQRASYPFRPAPSQQFLDERNLSTRKRKQYAPPTPPDEDGDEGMGEEWSEHDMEEVGGGGDDDDDEEIVERQMSIDPGAQRESFLDKQRGRRKE